ncbi:MAG: SDR family oxidoreductase [Candidatus Limnocylindrales bacterium]
MRIAITGTGGRLGSALVAAFMREAPIAPAVSVESWARPSLDLDRPETLTAVVRERRPDLVIHAAAWTDVDGCAAEPDLAMRRNGEATAALAAACNELGADLLYVSTNEVFDGRRTDGRPYAEDDRPSPPNAYGRSKWAGEKAVLAGIGPVAAGRGTASLAVVGPGTAGGTGEQAGAATAYGAPAMGRAADHGGTSVADRGGVAGRGGTPAADRGGTPAADRGEPRRWVVRTSWLYGPPGADFPARIIAAAARTAARGAILRLVADEFGCPTRAADLASGIVALVRARPQSGIYHLVNAGHTSRADWAEAVLRGAEIQVLMERVPGSTWSRPSTPPPWGVLGTSRAAQLGIILRGWRAALFDEVPRLLELAVEARASAARGDGARGDAGDAGRDGEGDDPPAVGPVAGSTGAAGSASDAAGSTGAAGSAGAGADTAAGAGSAGAGREIR